MDESLVSHHDEEDDDDHIRQAYLGSVRNLSGTIKQRSRARRTSNKYLHSHQQAQGDMRSGHSPFGNY